MSAPGRDLGREWWEGAGSPGVDGYVLAVVVSAPVLGLLLAGLGFAADAGAETDVVSFGAALGFVLLVTVVGWVCSVAIAPLGVLLVHLVCLRVRAQWVHVLAAGVAGLLAGVAFTTWAGSGARLVDPFAWALAAATALGRSAVVPLVPRARRRRLARRERLQALLREEAQGPAGPHDSRPGSRPG